MNTTIATTSLNTPPMAPTSNPVKLFKEEIAKTGTYSGKLVKIQAQIDSLKEEENKIKDLDLPICKQFLDHAIKSLDREHDKVSTTIKCILNQSRITDVNELPEEMIRVFHNPSLATTPAAAIRTTILTAAINTTKLTAARKLVATSIRAMGMRERPF